MKNFALTKVLPAGAITAWALTLGCGPIVQQPARRPAAYVPPVTCNAYFPSGIGAGSPYSVNNPSVAFHITASYTFKDPTLAHESIPQVFIRDMNTQSPHFQYSLADGNSGNISINLNVNMDSTSDHYGMYTQVSGPTSFHHGPGGTVVDTSLYFAINENAEYVTGEKLLSDAATRVAGYLNNGWTCVQGQASR